MGGQSSDKRWDLRETHVARQRVRGILSYSNLRPGVRQED